jgi:hypothetical protein
VLRRSAAACAIATLAFTAAFAEEPAAPSQSELAEQASLALLARYEALREQLEHSLFGEPVYVESVERSGTAQGDVYGVVGYPIATLGDALSDPARWCDVLILHLNVKYCRPVATGPQAALSVAIGSKHDEPLEKAPRIEFIGRVEASRPDYVGVVLESAKGPLGTGDYRIAIEASRLEDERTFLHLRYSYAYGLRARIAMSFYLATSGSGKVGFTTTGDPDAAEPRFVRGLRGAIERNAMRYYLAIDAYLGTLDVPGPDRFERSIERWFDATERYARQLHEVDRESYLAMKRREYLRQQPIGPPEG